MITFCTAKIELCIRAAYYNNYEKTDKMIL